jgi:hypothetical protein
LAVVRYDTAKAVTTTPPKMAPVLRLKNLRFLFVKKSIFACKFFSLKHTSSP